LPRNPKLKQPMGWCAQQEATWGMLTEPHPEVDAWAAVVVDAALEVHRHLGPAFLEAVYENALCHELSLRGAPHARQVVVPVKYKGLAIGEGRVDVLVASVLVVELKSLPALLPAHTSQVISYLKTMGLSLGLLLNFGERHLTTGIRRVVLSR
jgi:GxxExxY protein